LDLQELQELVVVEVAGVQVEQQEPQEQLALQEKSAQLEQQELLV
jgi:hypothetical protein